MDPNDAADDLNDADQRMQDDADLGANGVRSGELSADEREDILNDLHSDRSGNSSVDEDDDKPADMVPIDENDGNDGGN